MEMTDQEFEALFERMGFNLDRQTYSEIHAHRAVLDALLKAIPCDLPFELTPDVPTQGEPS